MTKILRVSNESMESPVSVRDGVPSNAVTFNILQNITEIIPLVIKSVCENTPADVVNNSELGQRMIQSIVVSRLTAKLHPVIKS